MLRRLWNKVRPSEATLPAPPKGAPHHAEVVQPSTNNSISHQPLITETPVSPSEEAPPHAEAVQPATNDPILHQPSIAETASVSIVQVEQEPQIPDVPKSLPSQVDETLQECPKFRIVLVGKSGVGKSSLVQNFFNINSEQDLRNIDISHDCAGKADIEHEYVSSENPRFILHDSMGFEHGSEGNWTKVEKFLSQRHDCELPKKIHSIWFCVETPLTGSRLLQEADEGLLTLAKRFNIPIIAVFTKYDLLVTQFWRKDRQPGKSIQDKDKDAERNASNSFDLSVKQLQEDWAKLSKEDISIPCVKISKAGPNATEMLKDLGNETHKKLHELEDQLLVLWVAAQQVNASKKVEVSISEGFKKYWLNLGQSSPSERQSSPFEGQILIDCVHRIHDDVLKVWNFNDPTKILSGTKFFTGMMGLVKPFIDRHVKKIPLSAESSSSFGNTGAIVLRPLLREYGFGPQAIQYLCGNYKKYPSTAKLLSTYIINLIVVLHTVFSKNLGFTPPRALSNEFVFDVLMLRKADLEQRTLDNIDSAEEFDTHPEQVIAKVIGQLLPD